MKDLAKIAGFICTQFCIPAPPLDLIPSLASQLHPAILSVVFYSLVYPGTQQKKKLLKSINSYNKTTK